MHQTGMMLAALMPALQPGRDARRHRRALAEGRIPVWLPLKLSTATQTIPRDWTTTSDGLGGAPCRAAWRRPVVLVKSCRVAARRLRARASPGTKHRRSDVRGDRRARSFPGGCSARATRRELGAPGPGPAGAIPHAGRRAPGRRVLSRGGDDGVRASAPRCSRHGPMAEQAPVPDRPSRRAAARRDRGRDGPAGWVVAHRQPRHQGRGADDREHRAQPAEGAARRRPRHRAGPQPHEPRPSRASTTACRSSAGRTRSSTCRSIFGKGGKPPDLSKHDMRIFAEIVDAPSFRSSSWSARGASSMPRART